VTRLVLLFIFFMALSAIAQAPADQYVVMVFDRSQPEICPLTIDILPDARLEIPLDRNGDLVKAKAKLIGIRAIYRAQCGRMEVRRASTQK
jgi:hypothetical protein